MALTNKQFMTAGMYIFMIIAIFNLLFFLTVFENLHIYQIVSQLAGIIFNFLLVYMFASWRNQQDGGSFQEYKEPEDIEKALEALK